MEQKSGDFSMQNILHLANDPNIRQLFALLQRTDPQGLQQAAQQASDGTLNAIPASLKAALESDEAKKLLQKLGG